jgi:hypothetical protein
MTTNGKKSEAQLRREIGEVLEARKRERMDLLLRRTAKPASSTNYELREIQEAQGKLAEVRRAPLADRKEAARDFFEAMRDNPQIVGERVGWLIDGNYGYGSMLLAKRVLGAPRSNRAAALTQMVGAFEWQAPEEMTRAAWKKLTAAQQAALDRAVQKAIRAAETE